MKPGQWSLTKSDRKRINSFELWCWCRMLCISWIMKRTNDRMLQDVQSKTSLLCLIQSQLLRYFGHIARRDGDCLEKVIMQGQVEGSRKPGRPRTRWIDQIKSLARSSSLQIFILLPRIIRNTLVPCPLELHLGAQTIQEHRYRLMTIPHIFDNSFLVSFTDARKHSIYLCMHVRHR